MECPNCRQAQPDDVPECGRCGLVFAKWKARQDRPDPTGRTGSAEWVGSASGSADTDSSSGSFSRLTGILIILLLGARAFLWMQNRSGNASPGAPGYATKRGGAIDPASYQNVLIDLEAILYKEGLFSSGDSDVAGAHIQILANHLRKLQSARGNRAAEDLEELGERFRSPGPTPLPRADRIREWQKVRDRNFQTAAWFTQLQETAEGANLTLEDAIQRLQRTTHNLSLLIDSGETEAASFGAEPVDAKAAAKSKDFKKQLERWRGWVPGWTSRVDEVVQELPLQSQLPKELWQAHQDLLRLATQLKAVPNIPAESKQGSDPPAASESEIEPIYLPDKGRRESWFADSRQTLAQAIGRIEEGRSTASIVR